MAQPASRPLRTLAVLGLLAGAPHVGSGAAAGQQTSPGASDQAGADAAEPGAELRVWLLTAAPGDAVWERYGHNALRVLDTRTGRDVSYNWGIFDFEQVDFIPRFLQGRMLYRMAPFDTRAMIASYAQADREVRLQELALTPAQKLELSEFAENNALPENRNYTYQYFVDNCSTRVRDLLDLVLRGAVRDAYAPRLRGATYRLHTRRLTHVDPLVFTGMDLALGAPTDRPISVWDEMFIPMVLADELRSLRVPGPGGVQRPLVVSDEIVSPSSRSGAPAAPPGWLWVYLVLGVTLGGLLAAGSTSAVRESAPLRGVVLAAGTGWSLLGGVLGVILVGLHFTDHTFSYPNQNLLLVHPLMLATAVLLPSTLLGGRWPPRAAAAAAFGATLALAGLLWHLLPFGVQMNGIHLAVAVPAHVGLAWGMRPTRMADQSGTP